MRSRSPPHTTTASLLTPPAPQPLSSAAVSTPESVRGGNGGTDDALLKTPPTPTPNPEQQQPEPQQQQQQQQRKLTPVLAAASLGFDHFIIGDRRVSFAPLVNGTWTGCAEDDVRGGATEADGAAGAAGTAAASATCAAASASAASERAGPDDLPLYALLRRWVRNYPDQKAKKEEGVEAEDEDTDEDEHEDEEGDEEDEEEMPSASKNTRARKGAVMASGGAFTKASSKQKQKQKRKQKQQQQQQQMPKRRRRAAAPVLPPLPPPPAENLLPPLSGFEEPPPTPEGEKTTPASLLAAHKLRWKAQRSSKAKRRAAEVRLRHSARFAAMMKS